MNQASSTLKFATDMVGDLIKIIFQRKAFAGQNFKQRLFDPELWCLIIIATLITSQSVAQSTPLAPQMVVECIDVPVVPQDAQDFQEIRVDGKNVDHYSLIRSWSKLDMNGNLHQKIQKIGVIDTTPPRLYFAGHYTDTSVYCANDIPKAALPIAVDECSKQVDVKYFEHRFPGEMPGDMKIERTWTAADLSGNATSHTQWIIVADTKAPIFTHVPKDLNLVYGTAIPFEHAAAYDDCDSDLTIMYQDETAANGIDINRIWIARDNRGNTISAIQYIHFIGNNPPQLQGIPNDLTVECDDVPAPAKLNIKDAAHIDIDFSEKKIETGTGYLLVRTWTATDAFGNTAFAEQLINVKSCFDAQKNLNAGIQHLHSVAPNPFNTSTNISFTLAETGHATLEVYDLRGQLIEELFTGKVNENETTTLEFRPSGLNAGTYIYRLRTKDANLQGQLVLLH